MPTDTVINRAPYVLSFSRSDIETIAFRSRFSYIYQQHNLIANVL